MESRDSSNPVKTANILHEIKQPISAITLLAEFALHKIGEPATQKRPEDIDELLKRIMNQGQLCSRIIKKMQKSDKANSPDLVPAGINDIIHKAFNKVSLTNGEMDLSVRLDLQQSLPEIKVDEDAILQLMTNLIANAFDAMRFCSQKKLTVRSHKTNCGISVIIIDTGCGIDKTNRQKIFNSRYTTKGDDGMGLGLSICKAIIDEHNGSITVTSQRDTGTQFKVYLPFK